MIPSKESILRNKLKLVTAQKDQWFECLKVYTQRSIDNTAEIYSLQLEVLELKETIKTLKAKK